MKYIHKGAAPRELQGWINGQPFENERHTNCTYDDMPGDVKDVIRQRLLEEQGWLCCYTGVRMAASSSHIEHLKPQSRCQEYEDVDYANLLAAYPGDKVRCEFGAKAKDDWYDEQLLVSPLHLRCETQFQFDQFGRIRSANDGDLAAQQTIRRLRLDHESLTEMRGQAIDEALFPKHRRISEAQLRTVIESFCSRNDAKHPFRSFCFVVVQAARELLLKAQREHRRRQAIRSQSHR